MKNPAAAFVPLPPARAGLLLAHLAVFVLVLVSGVETIRSIADTLDQISGLRNLILIAAASAALLPAGSVLVRGARAIRLQIDRLLSEPRRDTRVCRAGNTAPGARTGNAVTVIWMGAALLVALGLAASALAGKPINRASITGALVVTARFSFLLFWPAYAGGALAALGGPRWRAWARYGREFGVAYAAAQLVHFALVGWLIPVARQPLVDGIMPFFALGAVWTAILAISSADRGGVFDTEIWRVLRNLGVDYIALVFFSDLVLVPIHKRIENSSVYIVFSIAIIAGALLRVTAASVRLARARRR
jgi:hypothetical protein